MNRTLPRIRTVLTGCLGGAAILAAFATVPAPARGQSVGPHIFYVLPPGGTQGTEFEIKVVGRQLVGATGVRVSGDGVAAEVVTVTRKPADPKQKRLDLIDYPDTAVVKITIDADAAPGERDLRIITPAGAGNRFRFFVDQLTEFAEAEPNSDFAEARSIDVLPATVSGQCFQADRDLFRFQAEQGQTFVFELLGQTIVPYIADGVPGWFQPTLTLYREDGRQIAFADDFRHHPDPVLIHTFAAGGTYFVEVRDALYRGRDDFVYRLRMGELPFITHVFPLGATRGSKTDLQLYGVHLPQEKMTVDLTGPDIAESDAVVRTAVGVTAGALATNRRLFAVGNLPDVREVEPNNNNGQVQAVAFPACINGTIEKPGDNDIFAFSGRKDQRIVAEVFARRLDSPLDASLTLRDGAGKYLAQNDDFKDESEGLVTHHCDARVAFTLPEDGTYQVLVRGVQGGGGTEYAYRLELAPPRPDFVLRVRPDCPVAPQDAGALVTVTAIRRDGFDGPIQVRVAGLPEGFENTTAGIPSGENEVRFTLPVPADAAVGMLQPQVLGTATIGGKSITRTAVPAEHLMQAFYYMHLVPTQELVFSVVEAGPFTLKLDLPPGKILEIPRRGKATVAMKVKRGPTAKGPVAFKPQSPPKGMRVQAPPIAADADETTISVVTQGQQIRPGQAGVLTLSGTMKIKGKPVSGFVPAIPYRIVK
jgi:hypothetical protein